MAMRLTVIISIYAHSIIDICVYLYTTNNLYFYIFYNMRKIRYSISKPVFTLRRRIRTESSLSISLVILD